MSSGEVWAGETLARNEPLGHTWDLIFRVSTSS